ncbi:MAG: diaminopimelate epimerase [Clostridia bacterium]|nr:diaminopimelate epimerase [Clostridia bacterium]
MRFTKMQGLGNDYIYVNCLEESVSDPSALAKKISDRHFGVGSDGLVLILPCAEADFRMRMFNSDGSEAEMCGNASRCVAKYVYDRGLTDRTEIRLMTGSGIREMKLKVRDGVTESVSVDMGAPRLKAAEIPTILPGDPVVNVLAEQGGTVLNLTCVSMGNPHAVTFVEDADAFDVHRIGPIFETCGLFPERANVEFATVRDRQTIRMRVWERGAGETMACGTGACATLVAAVLNGLTDRKATLVLNGGNLDIEWDEKTGHVIMAGPEEFVFDGVWE